MGTNNYVYMKGDYEGQVIKNLDTSEISFLIWSNKYPVELVTKTLHTGEETLAFKIRKDDTLVLQEFLTKLNGAPPKRMYEYSPSSMIKPKDSFITKIKRLFTND